MALKGRRGSFLVSDLEDIYPQIAEGFGLPVDEGDKVIEELDSHTGVVYLSGHRQYDFVHLSIQEFLMAMHAHRLPDAIARLVPGFPNEMALVVAYSTDPGAFLEDVLFELVKSKHEWNAFGPVFLSRLATERPTFQKTAQTGWIILTLINFVMRLPLGGPNTNPYEITHEIGRFMSDPIVQSAVALAANEADHFETTTSIRLIPRRGAHLPTRLAGRLRNTVNAGFLFPDEKPLRQYIPAETERV